MGKGNARPKCALSENIFTGNENAVLDDTTTLPDNRTSIVGKPKAVLG